MNPAPQRDEPAWIFEPSWTEPAPRRPGPDRRLVVGLVAGVATVGLLVAAALTWSSGDRGPRTVAASGSPSPTLAGPARSASTPSSAAAAASAATAVTPATADASSRSARPSSLASAGTSATSPASPASPASAGVATAAAVMCPDAALAAGVLPDTPSRSHVPWKGISGATVMLTNVGAAPCWLRGYPGVAFYNDDVEVSSVSGPGVIGDDRAEPTRVVLRPGQSAYSEIFWWDDGGDPIGVQRVSLIAPDHRTRLYVDVRWSQSTARDMIDVGPLTPTLLPDPGPGPTS